MKHLPYVILSSIVVVSFLLSGCGRIQRSQENDQEINLEMTVDPSPPGVGEATLVFTLADRQGQPINDATLEIEGNMTHAGMVPVFAQVSGGENGRYTTPFEWTMGGDWIVTVEVSLADGQTLTRQFPISVE